MQFFTSFLAGVVAFYSSRYFPFSTLFILLLSSALLFRKRKFFPVLFLVCGIVFAFIRHEPAAEIPYTKDRITVRGRFDSYPVKTETGNFKQTFTTASAVNTNTGEQLSSLSERDIILFSERAFDPGTECELAIKLLKSRSRLNPGQLARDDVYANLSEISREEVRGASLYSRIQGYRYAINKYIGQNLTKDSGAFVTSITTGEMTNMSDELRESFNVTGLAHILSISGSHFGLFSVLLFGMFRSVIKAFPYRFLQRVTVYLTPSQAAAVLCVPFMLSYLCLSGASIPAVRSFIMISLFLLGLIIGRKGYWLNSLLLAAFIIVVWEPKSIFDLSFQLSFLAVLFIGLAVGKREHDKQGGGKIYKYFRDSMLMTLSASLGTAPLVAYYFHYFSVISPISNLIAAPLIGFLLIPVSVVSCFLFLLTGHFVFTPVVSFFSDMSIAVVELLSRIPYASIGIPAFPPILLILFYPGLISYLLLNHLKSSKSTPDAAGVRSTDNLLGGDDKALETDSERIPRRLAAGLASEYKKTIPYVKIPCGLCRRVLHYGSAGDNPKDAGKIYRRFLLNGKRYIPAAFFIPFVIYFVLTIPEKKGFSVTFLDVGQGDSAVAELPDGKIMVIDTGRTGREAASFLKYRGRKTVDVLALSHVHPDHTGGLDMLSRKFRLKEIWDNGRIVYPDNLKTRSLSRGDVIEGKGYKIYAFHPYPGFYTMEKGPYVSENNDSLVLKMEGDSLSFLFTGDIEEEAEDDILQLGGWIRSDVVKVPHHGGRTSAHEPFIRVVSPAIAVISAGRDNSFGHPHRETLDALQEAQVYRTDMDGAVKISESGTGLDIKTYRGYRLRETESLSGELKNFRLLTETW